jgi:protein TonB
MKTFLNTLGILAAAAAVTFVPLAATTSVAGAQSLNPAAATSCSTPDSPATTAFGAEPVTPQLALLYNLTGTTYVQVDIDANGALTDASIAKSSGTPILDQAAIAAAKASSFRPAIHDCSPVAGSYIFQVNFPQ